MNAFQTSTGSSGALASRFRTCPTTGLSVHRTADNLIKAHAVIATVSLLVGESPPSSYCSPAGKRSTCWMPSGSTGS